MPEPTPPGVTSPNIMLSRTMPPPVGVSESWLALTAPVEAPVVATANNAVAHSPKRVSLPSIARAGGLGGLRAGAHLGGGDDGEGDRVEHPHRPEDRQPLTPVAEHRAQGPGQADGDQQDQQDLQQVGVAAGVLEGVGGVGVEEPAAVRPRAP